jgi:hypothetical protein
MIELSKFYCIHETNAEIFGYKYSSKFQFIDISVSECKQTQMRTDMGMEPCKSHEEINNYIVKNKLTFQLMYLNSYFDTGSYDAPINTYMDDQIRTILLPDHMKENEI